MRPKKAIRYECLLCGDDSHHTPQAAEDSCPVDVEEKQGFECGECGEFYDDRGDALECCK
jgi:hypothetical protein